MKHRGGWRLDQHCPGTFRWRSPLSQTYWARGDPIAPDLPEPIPRPGSDEADDDPDAGDWVLPIFAPRTPTTPLPEPPPPPEDIDDIPPF